MEAVYMSGNRNPWVVACSFQYLRSGECGSPPSSTYAGMLAGVQLPQRPGCPHPPPGDLGAVLPRFPEPSPAGATSDGTPAAHAGSLRTWKKGQAQSRPRSSDAATNHGGVSPGGANVEPAKPLSGPAAPGPPRLGCPLPGRGAGGCAKPQRLLLSGCGLSSLLRLLPEVRAQAGSSLNLLRASPLDV